MTMGGYVTIIFDKTDLVNVGTELKQANAPAEPDLPNAYFLI